MAKRGADELTTTTEKYADKKVKSDAHPEGSWVCTFCNNVNWPLRTHCNKRGCNMPRDQNGQQHPEGSWSCSNCSNINWPKRSACNKCHIPRPGLTPSMSQAPFNPQDHQPGSWVCPTCNNINWPARTVCNRKNCQTPRPMNAGLNPSMLPGMAAFFDYNNPSTGMMGGVNATSAMTGAYQSGMSGLPPANPYMPPSDPYASPYAMPPMQSQVSSAHPPGSWECPQCHNVNWPKRTTCNKKGCAAPKPSHLGGPSQYTAPQQQQQHPEGSWSCPSCNNVNWPTRTACNRKGCGLPRPAEL